MVEPIISIVTVSFNAVRTIRKTIESVLGQSGIAVEYIIIDGGSVDGTQEVIKEFSDRLAYWVSEPDFGIYDAMNKGLARANGKLIGILNADDVYLPGALSLVVDTFALQPNHVIHGDIEILDQGMLVDVWRGINPAGIESQFRKMTVNHPATFIPRAIYEKYGNYSKEYRLSSDYDLILRLIINNVAFTYLNCVLVSFSLGGNSGGIKTYQETLEIQRAYGRGFMSSWLWFWVSLVKMSVAKRLPRRLLNVYKK